MISDNDNPQMFLTIISILLLILCSVMTCLLLIFLLIGKLSSGNDQAVLQSLSLVACSATSAIIGMMGLRAHEGMDKAIAAVRFGCVAIVAFAMNILILVIINNYFATISSYISQRDYLHILISVVCDVILPLALPILYYVAALKNKEIVVMNSLS